MRYLLPAFLASLGALVGLGGTADAQACSPRPAIIVDQHADGWVGLTSTAGNVLSQIAMTSDPHYVGSQANVVVDLPGQAPGRAPGFSIAINPPVTSYVFQVHSHTPGTPATLPVTITDNCGPWTTFVGGGSANVFPTAQPTWTRTPTPIPANTVGPTRTPTALPVIATSTPLTSPQVRVSPLKVYQGTKQIWSWEGRTNPLPTDYLGLYNSAGSAVGPPLFTSSCTVNPGTVGVKQGQCEVTYGANYPPGNYTLRFVQGTSGAIITLLGNVQVVAVGGSIDGRGSEQGTTSLLDDDQIAIAGGFLAVKAFIAVPDPTRQASDSWYHIGLNSIGNFTGLFIEAGIHKVCAAGAVPECIGHPYMSFTDHNSSIKYYEWNGSLSGGPNVYWANFNIPLNLQNDYLFQIFGTAATSYTVEICDATLCCALWLDGLPCRSMGAGDQSPTTLQTRYGQVFGGTETLTPQIAGGAGDIGWPAFCCRINQTTWTPMDCWDHEWRVLDPSRVIGILTTCDPPYSGWGVQTVWR